MIAILYRSNRNQMANKSGIGNDNGTSMKNVYDIFPIFYTHCLGNAFAISIQLS